jgi:hypothetical protein
MDRIKTLSDHDFNDYRIDKIKAMKLWNPILAISESWNRVWTMGKVKLA